MIAQQAPPLEVRYHRLEVTNRWLLGIGAVILIALIALASWVAIDRFAVTGNAATADSWITAATGDSFADYQALYAPTAQILVPETNGVVAGYDSLENIWNQMDQSGLVIERSGQISSFGSFVTYDINWRNDVGYDGTGVVTLQLDNDGQIIAQTIYIEY